MRVLNCYAGLGGNRAWWPKHYKVTAIENNPLIAKLYQKQFPKDKVLVEDAHAYILNHYKDYDAIWTSPPCPSHSQMQWMLKHKAYPSMVLYEEIIFLLELIKHKAIIENVKPYYEPLIWPKLRLNHHYFWSRANLHPVKIGKFAKSQNEANNTKEREIHLIRWLDLKIKREELSGLRSRQVLDNCVHPYIGQQLMKQLLDE